MPPRTWYLHEDPELKLVHVDRSCPEARVASKYNYLVSVAITEGRGVMDLAVYDRCRPCPRCLKQAGKTPALAPPGFRGITRGHPEPAENTRGAGAAPGATRPRSVRRGPRREWR